MPYLKEIHAHTVACSALLIKISMKMRSKGTNAASCTYSAHIPYLKEILAHTLACSVLLIKK